MSTEAIVLLTQYAPNDGSADVRDKLLGTSNEVLMLDSTGVSSSTVDVQHLHAIQNPAPYAGRTSAYVTDDAEQWSDSPTKDPTLADRYRYSYGRDFGAGGRWRPLDNYAGIVMHDTDFSKAGDRIQIDQGYNGERLITDAAHTRTGDLLMQDQARVTGDTTINEYNLLVSASPVPYSYKNAVSTDVSIRLSNYVFPLASGTVTLSLNGENKTPLEITPFYTGLGGFDAKWYNDREFDYNQQVNVEWRVSDTDTPANEIVFNYWFRTVSDFVGPRISSVSPADDSTNIDVDTCLLFTLRDYETGVDINTLELYINNILIPVSDMTITVTSTSDGYDVLYCPPKAFLYGDEVPVSIYVKDLADDSNFLFHVYSFTTEDSLPPKVVSNDPRACREYIPVNKNVEVDVVDGGHGLDEDSIRLDVDDTSSQPRKRPIIYRED